MYFGEMELIFSCGEEGASCPDIYCTPAATNGQDCSLSSYTNFIGFLNSIRSADGG